MSYKYYQPNNKDIKDQQGDCVIRALTKALNKEWIEVFDELVPYAREVQTMPNCKPAYNKYLEDMGYKWVGLKAEKGKKRATPKTFCKEYKEGTYILALAHHLVTVVDGNYYDTWDCGNGCVYGYWKVERLWENY